MTIESSVQESMHIRTCFGCGTENAKGLRLKTRWNGHEGLCTFEPEPHMCAGPPRFVNGGIVATLIDCHAISTAIAHLYQAEGREPGTDPGIWCVTASLEVQYKRPTPIDQPAELRARVSKSNGRRLTVECTLESGGKLCAIGSVEAVRVDSEWTDAGG
jgi:acyl-coenzyme A thioesterase PaaI-like protein